MLSWTETYKNHFSQKNKFFTTIIYNPLHLRLPLYTRHILYDYTMPLDNLLIGKRKILIPIATPILTRLVVILFIS